jgi:hypothetical protein
MRPYQYFLHKLFIRVHKHNRIGKILTKYKMLGYLTYVDDSRIVSDNAVTDIYSVYKNFNMRVT